MCGQGDILSSYLSFGGVGGDQRRFKSEEISIKMWRWQQDMSGKDDIYCRSITRKKREF